MSGFNGNNLLDFQAPSAFRTGGGWPRKLECTFPHTGESYTAEMV